MITAKWIRRLSITALWVCLQTPVLAQSVEGENPSVFNTAAWRADNGQNTAWLWGVGLDTPANDQLRGEASYRQGQFNQGGDLEENTEMLVAVNVTQDRWQAGLGFRYLGFKNELRRGFVWSYPDEETERNADVYGPVLTGSFDFPLDWLIHGVTIRGLVMPYDFGELNDIGYNGRHAELDVDAYRDIHGMRMAIGYLYRYFDDMPDRIINDATFPRDEMQGFVLSAGILF